MMPPNLMDLFGAVAMCHVQYSLVTPSAVGHFDLVEQAY